MSNAFLHHPDTHLLTTPSSGPRRHFCSITKERRRKLRIGCGQRRLSHFVSALPHPRVSAPSGDGRGALEHRLGRIGGDLEAVDKAAFPSTPSHPSEKTLIGLNEVLRRRRTDGCSNSFVDQLKRSLSLTLLATSGVKSQQHPSSLVGPTLRKTPQ